jgi:hypothetical protein
MVEQRSDPAGCLDELRAALSQPELEALEHPAKQAPAIPGACKAALQVAFALGYCRLYGVAIEEDLDGVLPAQTALAAATALHQRLAEMARLVGEGDEPEREREGSAVLLTEDEEFFLDLLEGRMDAWAAFTAIEEALQDCLAAPAAEADPLEDQLDKAVDLLVEAAADLDERMCRQVKRLAVAADTNLLDNWRALLAEPWREPWPWWLDGTLEAAHKANLEEAFATMPDPAEWRRRVGRVKARRGYPRSVYPRIERPELAAAEGAAEAPRLGRSLRWISPDGVWTATLDLLTWSTPDLEKIRRPLVFSSDRSAPSELAGPARLGRATSPITDGLAYFTLAELREADELSLLVGENNEEWIADLSLVGENQEEAILAGRRQQERWSMTRSITREVLERWCAAQLETLTARAAFDAIRALGNLAPWWLAPEVLDRGRSLDEALVDSLRQARLREDPGSCWIVLVRKEPLPLLRSAPVLPLCWRENTDHDQRLPAGLRDLPAGVVDALQRHERVRGQRWGLGLSEVVEGCDLSGDPGFTWSSGWASLAGGLVLAAERLRPHRTVWASGAWENNELADVEGLEAKIETAAAFGASHFFVPSWRVAKARELAARRLQVGALTASEKDPRFVLADYLAQLGAEPPPPRSAQDEEQLAICRAYDERQPRGRARTEDFYWRALLPTIIDRCRQRVRQRWGDWSPEFLVTIASNNPALVPLSARVLGARNVLVLYTPQDKQIAAGVRRIESYFVNKEAKCQPFTHGPREQLLPHFRNLVWSFLPAGVHPEQVVFDVTPGKKVMSVTLADIAPRGSWLVYLEHTALYDRARPGTEDFDRWRAGEGSSLDGEPGQRLESSTRDP